MEEIKSLIEVMIEAIEKTNSNGISYFWKMIDKIVPWGITFVSFIWFYGWDEKLGEIGVIFATVIVRAIANIIPSFIMMQKLSEREKDYYKAKLKLKKLELKIKEYQEMTKSYVNSLENYIGFKFVRFKLNPIVLNCF